MIDPAGSAVHYRYVGELRVPVVPFCAPVYRVHIERLCEAQNWRCCYCGIRMETGRPGNDTPTVEHVLPRVAGGSDDWDNLAAACRLCNTGRGSMRYEKYLQFVVWKGREKAAKYGNRLRARIRRRDGKPGNAAGGLPAPACQPNP